MGGKNLAPSEPCTQWHGNGPTGANEQWSTGW
jgi:hypothetical protein